MTAIGTEAPGPAGPDGRGGGHGPGRIGHDSMARGERQL